MTTRPRHTTPLTCDGAESHHHNPSKSSKKFPRRTSEAKRMLIGRTPHGILGTAMAAAVAHVTSMAQTLAEAFEPDLESWETLPVAHAAVRQAG
jgi:hypothetical protein